MKNWDKSYCSRGADLVMDTFLYTFVGLFGLMMVWMAVSEAFKAGWWGSIIGGLQLVGMGIGGLFGIFLLFFAVYHIGCGVGYLIYLWEKRYDR